MKKLTKEILQRDAKRDIGAEVLQAIREIKAGKTGRVFRVEITEATEARLKLGMSQTEFAKMLGVSARTLQGWEQGRRQPSGAAKALLKVATASPAVVRKALKAVYQVGWAERSDAQRSSRELENRWVSLRSIQPTNAKSLAPERLKAAPNRNRASPQATYHLPESATIRLSDFTDLRLCAEKQRLNK